MMKPYENDPRSRLTRDGQDEQARTVAAILSNSKVRLVVQRPQTRSLGSAEGFRR